MDALGMNAGYLIIQLVVFGIWPLLGFFALLILRRTPLTRLNKALWALLIITIPILGSLAFFIVEPGKVNRNSSL